MRPLPFRFLLALALALAPAVAAGLSAPPPAHAAQGRAFVYTTDFTSGTVADVAFGPPRLATPNRAAACSDAVLRHHQGLLYVVERFGCDNIRVLDPANGYAVARQFSVGNGANPNDVVIVSPTKAYVTRYDRAELWIVDPSTGAKTGEITLAGFADADGLPEMARATLANGRLFVMVQRVNRDAFFTPTDSSQAVVIDTATDQLVDCDPLVPGVQGIVLPAQNPTTEVVTDPAGRLLVGCTGFYGALDGAVVRIDPVGLRVDGIEATEAALGGDLNDVVAGAGTSAARGFAVISDASFDTRCVAWARATGTLLGTVHASAGFTLSDAELNDRGELWLSDRTAANPGVRIFDAATGAALTAGPLSVGLPPQDLEFDGIAAVGITDGAVDPPAGRGGVTAPALAFAGAWPNPSRGEIQLQFAAAAPPPPGATLRVRLVDPAGRAIRTLETAADARTMALPWDGRDDAGRAVAPGVYAVHARIGPWSAAGRVVRVP